MSALAKQHNAINLSQGFPNYSSDPILFELVKKYMDQGLNQYAPLSGVQPLRGAIANKVKNLHQRNLDIDNEICITAGATQAVYTAIQAIVHPDDEVIIFEPAFDIYAPAITLAGGTVKRISTIYPEFKIDWKMVRNEISNKTKLIIINSPNNPSGNTFTKEDINQLERIVEEHNLYVLSDEVYEHLVYDKDKHLSLLDSNILYKRGIVTYSFGKTFHNTGWKVGYAIAPKNIMSEFKKIHQFIVFSVNTPVQYALADFLNNENNYIHLSSEYQKRRDFFLSKIEESRFKFLPTKGTYFQLLDYSDISNKTDLEFSVELVEQYGIASIPLSPFYSQPMEQKLLRICFAKTNDILEQAAEILCKI